MLLPEYGFYEGHLNCYNRDAWSDESGDKAWTVKGTDSHLMEERPVMRAEWRPDIACPRDNIPNR